MNKTFAAMLLSAVLATTAQAQTVPAQPPRIITSAPQKLGPRTGLQLRCAWCRRTNCAASYVLAQAVGAVVGGRVMTATSGCR